MEIDKEYPHGKCECKNECLCAEDPGPVAYSVIREGKVLLVCTCCRWVTDTHVVCLVEYSDNPEIYYSYDMMGALLLSRIVSKKAKENKAMN